MNPESGVAAASQTDGVASQPPVGASRLASPLERPPLWPELPLWALAVVVMYLPALVAWFSAWVYYWARQRCADHPLVWVQQSYDRQAVAARLRGYHKRSGRGRPIEYPAETMVAAEVVRSWAGNCSDPELERILASDLIARQFVGLPLLGPTPDHSTCNRFHAYWTEHHPGGLFYDVLAFLDEVDPEDPRTVPEVVDTFALQSPAEAQNGLEVLLRLVQRTLSRWAQVAPAEAQAGLPVWDEKVYNKARRKHTPEEQQPYWQQAVEWARQIRAVLPGRLAALPAAAQPEFEILLGYLGKVLADEVTLDAQGQVQELPAKDKGDYRLGSAVDPEATFRKHGAARAVLGRNAAISASPTRIRAAVAPTGNTPDSETPVLLIQQEQQAGLTLPAQLLMDQAGGSGKVRSAVAGASQGQTTMVARTPKGGGHKPGCSGPSDFVLAPDASFALCQQGVITELVYPRAADGSWDAVWLGKMCIDCPLFDRCRGAGSDPQAKRKVHFSPYHAHVRAATQFNQTEAGQKLLLTRSRIEAQIAWLVRYDGARRARRVGGKAAQFQLFQACAWRNLVLWFSRVKRGLAKRPEKRAGG